MSHFLLELGLKILDLPGLRDPGPANRYTSFEKIIIDEFLQLGDKFAGSRELLAEQVARNVCTFLYLVDQNREAFKLMLEYLAGT